MPETPSVELQELARSYGVQLEYRDMSGRLKAASTVSLMAILKTLGAELESEADAVEALRVRRLERYRRGVEPVVVLWEEQGVGAVEFWIPEGLIDQDFECSLRADGQSTRIWTIKVQQPNLLNIEGERFAKWSVAIPENLAMGYYRISLTQVDASFSATSFLIRAARKAYQGQDVGGKRPWGLFCPLYSLHSQSSWGSGDFSDLEALIEWTAGQGGSLVATLPMLASTFDGRSPIISPYSPTSRLCWNEFYLDLRRIPELSDCPTARALIDAESPDCETPEIAAARVNCCSSASATRYSICRRSIGHFFHEYRS